MQLQFFLIAVAAWPLRISPSPSVSRHPNRSAIVRLRTIASAVSFATLLFIPTTATALAATFLGAAPSAFASASIATYFSTRGLAPRAPSVATRTWQARTVSFYRNKTGTASIIRFGEELERILLSLPRTGPLFPKLQPMREAHRATEFRRACPLP